jgi:hypothetical protein
VRRRDGGGGAGRRRRGGVGWKCRAAAASWWGAGAAASWWKSRGRGAPVGRSEMRPGCRSQLDKKREMGGEVSCKKLCHI